MSDNNSPLQATSLTQNIITRLEQKTIATYVILTIIFLLASNVPEDDTFDPYILNQLKELLRIFPNSEKLAVHALFKIFKQDNRALFDLILTIPDNVTNDFSKQFATLNIISNESNEVLSSLTFSSAGVAVKNVKEDNIHALQQELQSIIYTLFFKDGERIVLLSQEESFSLQSVISKMNVWQGNLTFFPEVTKSFLIEDSSNNSERLTFKTLNETFNFKIRIDPFVVDPHAITKVSNDIVILGITRTLDFHRDLTINTTYAIEINYEPEKTRFNLNPKTGAYGTIIDWKNPLFNDLEKIFKLLNTKYLG